MSKLSLSDVLTQDFWLHLAGLIVIAIGLVDAWHFHQFSHDTDLLFIVGGVAGMGLKIINGSASQLRQAALETALIAAQAASAAAAVLPASKPNVTP